MKGPPADRALWGAGLLWVGGGLGGAFQAWNTHSEAPSLLHWALRITLAFGPGVLLLGWGWWMSPPTAKGGE